MLFSPLKNDLLLRAAKGQPVERTPVWVMRQAGRYLPEFLKLRENYTFFQMCQTPEVSCEVTLQPLKRFDLDAAIIFSDILVIPQAMGMHLDMKPGIGPVFSDPLSSPEDIKRLKNVKVDEDLKYVMDAITLTRMKLDGAVPLIGFSGAPWTVMCYMIEGQGSKTMSKAKKWLYKYPEDSHALLTMLSDVIVQYLVAQVAAGAQFVQLFDTNLGYLSRNSIQEFVIPYYKQIILKLRQAMQEIGNDVPVALFPKDAHLQLDLMKDLGYDVIGLDWCMDPLDAAKILGPNVTLQGNLDPCALYASAENLQIAVGNMMRSFSGSRHIANLGHGMYPDMDPDQVQRFVEAVHSFKPA